MTCATAPRTAGRNFGLATMLSSVAVSSMMMPGMEACTFCTRKDAFSMRSMGCGKGVVRASSRSQNAAKPVTAGTRTNCMPGVPNTSGGSGILQN